MSRREGIVVEKVEREEEMIVGEEERRTMRSRRGIRDILTERKQVRHHPGVIIPPAYYSYSHIPHYMLSVSYLSKQKQQWSTSNQGGRTCAKARRAFAEKFGL